MRKAKWDKKYYYRDKKLIFITPSMPFGVIKRSFDLSLELTKSNKKVNDFVYFCHVSSLYPIEQR